jgi:protein-L-isoaspartate(D-aspartate) O-methyltransferase
VKQAADSAHAWQMRDKLADQLVADRTIESKEVEAAFRAVPRHLFAPGASLEEAYAPDRVIARLQDEHGVTISSVSAPQVQAVMLEQAALGPGQRVLEIGSGGYNAALMAEMVSPKGEVTTIDIDPDVADRARRYLAAAGYAQVNVVQADGERGCPDHAPYDRIVVTAGAWDIPPAWPGQLAEEGTITAPLRIQGLTRSINFERADGYLVSRSVKVCGFVAMQGAGEHREQVVWLRGRGVGLKFDDGGLPDPGLLEGVLDTPQVDAWSGVTVGRTEPFDTLQMWLGSLDGFCLITASLDSGLAHPANRMGSPAAVDGASFTYLTTRPADEATVELGAAAFGPDAPVLAEAMAEQIRVWDRSCRGGPGPRIAVYPADTRDDRLPTGLVIDKRHVRVTVSWPQA